MVKQPYDYWMVSSDNYYIVIINMVKQPYNYWMVSSDNYIVIINMLW
jgi:hypothetical protein